MNHSTKKIAGTILKVSGFFSLFSFFQNLIFIRDATSFIVKNIEQVISFIEYVGIASNFLLEAYRNIVYPIFRFLPINLPTIWIDVLLALLLSDKLSTLLLKKSTKGIFQAISTPLLENDIITKEEKKEIERVYKLSFFGFFKDKTYKHKLGQYNIKVFKNIKLIGRSPQPLEMMAEGTKILIASNIFLALFIIMGILDLYYRFYIIP